MRFSFFDRANNPESRTSDPYPSGGTVEDLSDATLRILSLSAGTLDPVFSSAHTSYTASVGNEVSPITVTAVPNAAGASVTYLDGSDRTLTDFDPGSANTFEVDLSAGANVIKVMVTAEDEITTKTYAVTVTVTATNGDGIAATWMARFGRTVADQVLDAVDDRMSAPRTPGTEISLAGHRTGSVDSHGGRSGRADGIAGTAHAGTRGKTEAGRELEGKAEEDMAVGLRTLADPLGGDRSESVGWSEAETESRGITGREMLTGSSFMLTADSPGGASVALWGRGAVSSFDGRADGFGLDGEVVSAMLGVDGTDGRTLMGVATAGSRGDGAYRTKAGDMASGEIKATLTGVYPYGRYALNDRFSVWGVAGFGAGTLTLTPEGLAPMETDADLVMAATGGRGVLRQPLEGTGLELAVRSDALVVRTTTDAVHGSAGSLAATEAEVTRLRLGLEGTWHGSFAPGLVPTFEIGVRHDGGDAETGFGSDIGAGFTWTDPVRSIRAEFHARGLVDHEDGGFRERGLSGALSWDPEPDSDLGWSLGLAQSMGAQATGGMDALLKPDPRRVFSIGNSSNTSNDDDPDRRLEADVGYGFAVFGGRYTGTPGLGLRLSEGTRETVLGWRLSESQKSGLVFGLDVEGRRSVSDGDERGHSFGVGFGWKLTGGRSANPDFEVRFEGERLKADNDSEPEHRFGVRMSTRW